MTRMLSTSVDRLQDVGAQAIAIARSIGADHAVASVRAHAGMRITARGGAVDTALRDAGQGLTLTLYRGDRAGTATTAAFDPAAIAQAAQEALAIADLMGSDPDGLPPALADMAIDTPLPPIDAPSGRDPSALRTMALEGDALLAATIVPGAAIETLVAGVASSEGADALVTSAGFSRGERHSFHHAWLVAMARDGAGAVNDSADTNDRRFDRLDPMATLARQVAARTAGQLGARSISSRRSPILFEARAVGALIGDLVGALSGNPQHRGATFLPDALGRQVAAPHLNLWEDPFEPYGLRSGGYDREGIAGRRRWVLNGGEVQGLFLGTRSARRLGMTSTGNASGPWNLQLTSRTPGGSFDALCRQMGRGLIVHRMAGGATDPVTGNWTYAVAGSWVEDGVRVHAVTDVTVGGNLRDMLMGIVAVGDDVERSGAILAGSILIDDLQIGGAA